QRTHRVPDIFLGHEAHFEVELVEFAGSGFKVFAGMIASNPKVEIWAIPAKTGGSRALCDRVNAWAQSTGQPGLGYIFWRKEGDK
ncbi:hypothetical protein ACDA55_37330, partial [Rhizobium ruizarguesonis]